MPDAAPASDAATRDAVTFYLDAPSDALTPGRHGFHDAAGRSRLPRFLLWGCVLLFALGLAGGLLLEGWSFLQEHYWALVLWTVIVLLVYRFKFRERPRFQITGEGLSFRTKSYRAEHRVPWDKLERIDLEPGGIVLRRAAAGPLHLYFDELPAGRRQALRDALAQAARERGVPVAEVEASH